MVQSTDLWCVAVGIQIDCIATICYILGTVLSYKYFTMCMCHVVVCIMCLSCVDEVDECGSRASPCEGTCINTIASYFCLPVVSNVSPSLLANITG